jgi:hypothetical protein
MFHYQGMGTFQQLRLDGTLLQSRTPALGGRRMTVRRGQRSIWLHQPATSSHRLVSPWRTIARRLAVAQRTRVRRRLNDQGKVSSSQLVLDESISAHSQQYHHLNYENNPDYGNDFSH